VPSGDPGPVPPPAMTGEGDQVAASSRNKAGITNRDVLFIIVRFKDEKKE